MAARTLAGRGPTSREFPAAWTAAVEADARAHVAAAYPQEAVGIVDGGAYHRLRNIAFDPAAEVKLTDQDLIRVARDAQVFFHSHPDGLGCPSETDMVFQQQLGIPSVIMTWPVPDVFAFGDPLPARPLIGRGFRHGVHDCYAIIRDWYAEVGVTALWDQPRGWEWWTKGQDLYRENFEAAGFVAIPTVEATRRGDVVLFNFNAKVPMHGAIVIDRDLLLHHAAGVRAVDSTRLSALVPRSRYFRHATLALRRT